MTVTRSRARPSTGVHESRCIRGTRHCPVPGTIDLAPSLGLIGWAALAQMMFEQVAASQDTAK
jgi:hypothetical protein